MAHLDGAPFEKKTNKTSAHINEFNILKYSLQVFKQVKFKFFKHIRNNW